MEDLWKADIFFVVTTLAVIMAGIVLIVVAIYTVSILKELREVVRRIRTETDKLGADLDAARERVASEGWLAVMFGEWTKFRRQSARSKAQSKGSGGK